MAASARWPAARGAPVDQARLSAAIRSAVLSPGLRRRRCADRDRPGRERHPASRRSAQPRACPSQKAGLPRRSPGDPARSTPQCRRGTAPRAGVRPDGCGSFADHAAHIAQGLPLRVASRCGGVAHSTARISRPYSAGRRAFAIGAGERAGTAAAARRQEDRPLRFSAFGDVHREAGLYSSTRSPYISTACRCPVYRMVRMTSSSRVVRAVAAQRRRAACRLVGTEGIALDAGICTRAPGVAGRAEIQPCRSRQHSLPPAYRHGRGEAEAPPSNRRRRPRPGSRPRRRRSRRCL